MVLPVATEPKLTLAGATLRPACTPVALRVTVAGEFGAELTMEIAPVAAPAPDGA